MNYRLAYRIGFHPWEEAERNPEFVSRIAALVEPEEAGAAPHGMALDLGTGSGIWAVWLAKRGWQVTAVDNVEKAIERARKRVRAAEVEVRLVQADVARLRSAEVGSGFRLLLDLGTFHGLSPADRVAMAREVTAIAAPGATLLLLAWAPRRRGPLPHGADRSELDAAFPGCHINDEGPTGFHTPPPLRLLRPDEHWFRIRFP
jgi:SAM-dependent methyltransferase